MELVDRIHLDPLGGNLQVLEQLPGESRGISQQRIKMRCGVEDKASPPERGAESAEHVMPLDQQDLESCLGQNISAEQAADARPDDYRVVGRGVVATEDRRHGETSNQKAEGKSQK